MPPELAGRDGDGSSSIKAHGGLVEKRMTISMQLAAQYIGSVGAGIQEHLRPLLMSYNRDLGGVALCFRDVRLCGGGGSGGGGGLAKILYENPGIFVKVSVTLLLFAPRVGDVLVGRVNFVGHDHIGLTVHGLLKASISQSEFPPSYSLDDGATCWGDSSSGRNLDLRVGREVIFAVTKLDSAADGLLVISGSLLGGGAGRQGRNEQLGPTDAALVEPTELPGEGAAAAAADGDGGEGESEGDEEVGSPLLQPPPAKKFRGAGGEVVTAVTARQNGQVKTAAAPSQGSSSKKKTKKGGELSADALEAQLLASNGGEALTHSQQRQLKKLRKKEKQVQQQSAG